MTVARALVRLLVVSAGCAACSGGSAPPATSNAMAHAVPGPDELIAEPVATPAATDSLEVTCTPVVFRDGDSGEELAAPSDLQPRAASSTGEAVLATAYDAGLYVLRASESGPARLEIARRITLPDAPEHAKYVDAAFGLGAAEYTIGMASFGAFVVSDSDGSARPLAGLASPNVARVLRLHCISDAKRDARSTQLPVPEAALAVAFTPIGFADVTGGAQLFTEGEAHPALTPAIEGLDPNSTSRVVDIAATPSARLVLATSSGLLTFDDASAKWTLLSKGLVADLEPLDFGAVLAAGEHYDVVNDTGVHRLTVTGDLAPRVRGGARAAAHSGHGRIWLLLNRGAVARARLQGFTLAIEQVLEPGNGIPSGPTTLLSLGAQGVLLGTERSGLHVLQESPSM